MRYCQGNRCHEYRTKDRIRGTKGSKHYQTRRRSDFYYADNFCSRNCMEDWLKQNIEHALNHFGRVTQPKKVLCDQAWYKDYSWQHSSDGGSHTLFQLMIYLVERIPITQQQYNNTTTEHNNTE